MIRNVIFVTYFFLWFPCIFFFETFFWAPSGHNWHLRLVLFLCIFKRGSLLWGEGRGEGVVTSGFLLAASEN